MTLFVVLLLVEHVLKVRMLCPDVCGSRVVLHVPTSGYHLPQASVELYLRTSYTFATSVSHRLRAHSRSTHQISHIRGIELLLHLRWNPYG